ncbi:MAG: ABC transporter ATP-binding protein [Pseudomonadota bacterium]
MTSRLRTDALTLAYGKTDVLKEVSVALPDGQITAIVGPNGSGKTSLLRCLARLERPTRGAAILDDSSVHKQNTRKVAQTIALLPQSANAPAGMRVGELVARGRTPHQSPLKQWSQEDEAAVERALSQVGLTTERERPVDALSGGQRQRAWLAMVLAQETPILLLDEPTTFLDLRYQLEVLTLVAQLQEEHALTVAMVLHDINLAARFAHRILALREGRVVADGAPSEVVTQSGIFEIYALNARVIPDPTTGTPHVIPA